MDTLLIPNELIEKAKQERLFGEVAVDHPHRVRLLRQDRPDATKIVDAYVLTQDVQISDGKTECVRGQVLLTIMTPLQIKNFVRSNGLVFKFQTKRFYSSNQPQSKFGLSFEPELLESVEHLLKDTVYKY